MQATLRKGHGESGRRTSFIGNRNEVIAVDQNSSPVARPVSTMGDQKVWATKNPDGSFTVALFNLAAAPEPVTAHWAALGFRGDAAVRDLWNHQNLGGHEDQITEALPAHGSRLFSVRPGGGKLTTTSYEAEATGNTLTANAAIASCPVCSGGKKVGNLYLGGKLQFNGVTVKKDGLYTITVAYISGDSDRTATVYANSGSGTDIRFPNTGDWNTVHTISFQLGLKAGSNSITFDSGNWYSPDIDKIDVPTSS